MRTFELEITDHSRGRPMLRRVYVYNEADQTWLGPDDDKPRTIDEVLAELRKAATDPLVSSE